MSILLGILITSFSYLICPLICRCSQGKFSPKKGNLIAIVNTSVIFAFFCLLNICLSNGTQIAANMVAAVTYFFITRWILIDKNIVDVVSEDNEEDIYTNNDYNDDSIINSNKNISNEKIKYCFNCGQKISKNTNYCSHCGKKINKQEKRK